MAQYFIQEETLRQLGDAIREKTGSSEQMTPGQMVNAILDIENGASEGRELHLATFDNVEVNADYGLLDDTNSSLKFSDFAGLDVYFGRFKSLFFFAESGFAQAQYFSNSSGAINFEEIQALAFDDFLAQWYPDAGGFLSSSASPSGELIVYYLQ